MAPINPVLDSETRILLNHNPWWESEFSFDNDTDLIKLKDKKFIRQVDWFENLKKGIYILRGPRQVGKTTAIKQKILQLTKKYSPGEILYLNVTNYSNKELDILLTKFLSLNKQIKFIFIDEISYIENWSKLIKSISDFGFFEGKTVILTGSNTLDMRYEYETMPGRTGEGKRIIAKPVSYKEYLELVCGIKIDLPKKMYNQIDFLNAKFEEYLLTGGLPAVINDYLSTGKINDSFYDIYIKWIIGDIEKYRFKSNTAKAILKKVIASLGSKVSWESLNEYAGVSHVTVAEYIDVLERSFLVNYYYNATSGSVDSKKRKKIYFLDPFFYFCVYKWIFGEINMYSKAYSMLKDTKLLGLIKENCVSSFLWQQIVGLSDTIDYKTKIFFFSPSRGKEVDFVFDNIYLEVKSEDSNRQSGIVLTKDKFEKNKIPLAIFLLYPPTEFKKR
ncbi:MAG: hypothetical protein COT55_01450 [Candidatus Diapherotrites archaeon CG09_land_8_20_14_0_10_32_12]|nr:MAG: hypothetical protein COT55_01450 [Candidatus Diapherotrites archaeon CG09_land_8_20_14_0_10_32_12]